PVHVEILSVRPAFELSCAPLRGTCLDDQDLEFEPDQTPCPDRLTLSQPAPFVREILVWELLKSNCPVTGQPDWASLQIRYAGPRIDHAGLLRYIVSPRRHQEFHELCVETIYGEIMQRCAPEALLVYARSPRRGGPAPPPWRANHRPAHVAEPRTLRQGSRSRLALWREFRARRFSGSSTSPRPSGWLRSRSARSRRRASRHLPAAAR